jgi:hypothetical protein
MFVLLACHHPPDPDRPKPHATGSTGETAGETGLGTPTLREPAAPLSPSVSIDGIGVDVGLIPAFSKDPSALLLRPNVNDSTQTPPETVFLRGDITAGSYALLDLWDGVSGYDYSIVNNYAPLAGDVNQDGHLDIWLGEELFLGPLLGRTLRRLVDSHAHVEGLREWAVAGNFDADGDGHLDVLFKADVGAWSFIRYGPFEGVMPSAVEGTADPATYTRLGESSFCSESDPNTAILRDHLGPGHDAVAVGTDSYGWCALDTFVWDLKQPRGQQLTYAQALAATEGTNSIYGLPFDDAGDLDGDGFGDAVWGGRSGSRLVGGPMSGTLEFSQGGYAHPIEQINGYVSNGVGDINGDGIKELVGMWMWRGPDGEGSPQGMWVLLFSPHPDPIDLSQGLELGWFEEHVYSDLGRVDADLDGDGRTDLVSLWSPPEFTAHTLAIWYSVDLLEAWESRQAGR